MLQPTRAFIHLNRFQDNILNIRKRIGPGRRICLALKADAYGHGAIPLAKFVQERHLAEYIGVATVSEGIQLRQAGITLPILKFSPCLPEEIMDALKNRIILTVASERFAKQISQKAFKANIQAEIHVKIDTGMGRIGFNKHTCIESILSISRLHNIKISGIYTHFPVSDIKNKDFSIHQIVEFREICSNIESLGLHIPIHHMANSGAILDLPESFMDMVRPGIMLYGYPPSAETTNSVDILPIMTLATRINFIKRFYPGETISYGRTYEIKEECFIATLPAGYADGYNRRLSNKGKVIIDDKFYPVVGRVCMDQIMINLGKENRFDIGQQVVLMGYHNGLRFDAFDIADIADTISYEITCNINKRVPREYIYEEKNNLFS